MTTSTLKLKYFKKQTFPNGKSKLIFIASNDYDAESYNKATKLKTIANKLKNPNAVYQHKDGALFIYCTSKKNKDLPLNASSMYEVELDICEYNDYLCIQVVNVNEVSKAKKNIVL